MEQAMTYFLWAMLALVPVALLAALVLMVRCPGKWRKRFGWSMMVLFSAVLLLFPGSWLLGKLELAWRSGTVWALVLAAGGGIIAVLVYINCWLAEKSHPVLQLLAGALAFCMGLTLLFYGFIFTAFAVGGERVIRHEGKKVVEVDRSFLDPLYQYYDYHGPLIRGSDSIYSAIGESPWQRWEDEKTP